AMPKPDAPQRQRTERLFRARQERADAPKATAGYHEAQERLRDRTKELRQSQRSMPNSKISIFTSIPRQITRIINSRDFGRAWQTACIKSWKDAGFRVVSLNTREEIVGLASLESSVEFKEISKDQTRPRI